MKKYAIAALGELLIDFTEAGVSPSGMRLYEQNPGGAPANVLCIAARQGLKTAFLGKVGQDMHGQFLRSVLDKEGIDTRGLVMSKDFYTTLAFVSLSENGEREFSFVRGPGADTLFKADELDTDILSDCGIFHFGSLSLTDEPARETTFRAAVLAAESGAIISYDPNYRSTLWESEAVAVELMRKPLSTADIVKVSDEEALLLTGKTDIESAANAILRMGPRLAIVTRGSGGAMYSHDGRHGYVPAFRISGIADTTGAGDAFWGAFLSRLSEYDGLNTFLPDIEKHMRFANAAAALCVSRFGAIPAMPRKAEIEEFLNDRRSDK